MLRKKDAEINGISYTLQAIPFKSYMSILDRHTNKHGVLMKTPYLEEMLENCVINPKVKLDSFDDDFESGMMLVAEIESFLQSKTQPEPVETKSKK